MISGREAEIVHSSDAAEYSSRTHLVKYLKDHLDAGARKKIEALRDIGGETLFPETPIATQILMQASTVHDLLDVALQLRARYGRFRRTMAELEAEMASDDVSLKRKDKLIREIQAVAREIWPERTNGVQRVTQELANLGKLASQTMAGVDPLTLGEGVRKLPFDVVFSSLKRRKVRVIIRSKKEFLRARVPCSK